MTTASDMDMFSPQNGKKRRPEGEFTGATADPITFPPVGCETLSEGVAPVAADIVFVHGLRGHRIRTWTKDDVCWPRDLLAKEEALSHVRVLTFGYDANIIDLASSVSQNALFEHSQNLLSALARQRDEVLSRPIVFVAHSFGGLVVKDALNYSYTVVHTLPSFAATFGATKGIIFLGTPHRGGDKSGWDKFIESIVRMELQDTSETLLQDLKRNSQTLDRIQTNFSNILSKRTFRVYSFMEELSMSSTIGKVVETYSANIGDPFETRETIHANHVNMVKFQTYEDAGYQAVSFAVKKLVREITGDKGTFSYHGVAEDPKDEPFLLWNRSRIMNITGPLRGGGFCDIYLGEIQCGGHVEKVAMKLLRMFSTDLYVKKAQKKFRHEVELWRFLRHSNVLPFYGTYELDEHRIFMISPWASGGTSLEYLQRNPTANRGQLLWQTAGALEYLHSGRDAPPIAHGDLKADNILISATGDALLSDFGLSRMQDISQSSSLNPAGHLRFMAPELIMPPKVPSARPSRPTPASDVFSFASLILQVYTERLPFFHLTEAQSMFEIIEAKLPPRPEDPIVLERGFTGDIWTLMTECWHFEAEKRPAMALVVSQLKTALHREK